MEGSSANNPSGRPGWGAWLYPRREAAWYVLLFITPYLAFSILVESHQAVLELESTGEFRYPGGYVLIAVLNLLLCALVPFLLKDSEPSFRLGGILLTSIAPALLTGWVWYGVVRFVENEQSYRTSDSEGSYFVTRRAYEIHKHRYGTAGTHKAIAQSDSGAWAWTADQETAMEAAEIALVRCMEKNVSLESKYPCEVIKVDELWVVPDPAKTP